MTTLDLAPVLPEILLACGAMAVLLLDLYLPESWRPVSFWGAQITLLICAWATWHTSFVHREPVYALSGFFVDDLFGGLLKFFSYIAVSLMLFYSRRYLELRGLFRGETFVLAMTALLGMMVMVSAASFLTLYLGLELL